MQITIKHLQAFVWVVDLGSFRGAADRLNTTQPNISARIASLEESLGVTLMSRDAGSVRLTAQGEKMLVHARTVLKTLDDLVDAANQESLLDDVLRLGVTEMIVHTWLGDFLRRLKDRFPQMSVELTVDLSARLDELFSQKAIDLSLQSGAFDDRADGFVDLGTYPYIWIASPELGLQKPNLNINELTEFPLLTHARDTEPYRQLSEHFRHQKRTVRLVPSSNLAACIQMALDGYGSAAVPSAMVQEEIREGHLVGLDYRWTPDNLAFSARYDSDWAAHYVRKAAELAGRVSAEFRAGFES
ncbi:MAG: LysR family transcriptional regulator [Pseudomonadota bacterium]